MNSKREEYARQSLFGLALGDCFGQTFFEDRDTAAQRIAERRVKQEPWRFTDDTVMGIGVYNMLQRCGTIHQTALAEEFARNYLLDWHRGYGATAHDVLRALGEGRAWQSVSPAVFDGMGSMGNGAAMRAAPIGAFFYDDLSQVVRQAKRAAEVTHFHPEGIAGAIAVAVASALLLRRKIEAGGDDAVTFIGKVAEHIPKSETKTKVMLAAQQKGNAPVQTQIAVLGNGESMTAQDTVPYCIWCAAHYCFSLEEALWKAVEVLGDRDTICAIVGSMVALCSSDVPAEWVQLFEKPEESPFWVAEGKNA